MADFIKEQEQIDEVLCSLDFERLPNLYTSNFYRYKLSITVGKAIAVFFIETSYTTSEISLIIFGLKYSMTVENSDLLKNGYVKKIMCGILEESVKSIKIVFSSFINEVNNLK